ncbi:pheromone-regulated protein PRM1 [Sugiyamaella lignohabitans]|uniref:Plasma membrane fusion protein PRM1 n=1 Tax=Sugiyamaella lignohabitans TaxID=796027 RepID=A0A167CC53_9ASCO|nr:pheromone-regulated protein PRM1 [Sugiyamaella lignohabitans]ANB11492.1 pheromone-regulated protein PRM1 [Sugiyamaella lignohabitans]
MSTVQQLALMSCSSAQSAMTSAMNLPQTLTNTANSLISMGIDESVAGLLATLRLLIIGVQNLVIFSLDMWVGTYACLAVSLIDGTITNVANATESIISFTNNELQSVTADLETGLDDISSALNDVAAFVSDMESFFSGDSDGISKVNLSINSLKNLQIPTSINLKLNDLKDNLPSYDTVKTAVENEIKEPFTLLYNQLNDTIRESINFRPAPFTASPQNSSIYCTPQQINTLFNEISHDIDVLLKAFLITMAVMVVLICVPVAYQEYSKLRWLNTCADLKSDRIKTSTKQANLIIINMAMNRWTVRLQDMVARVVESDNNKAMSRWLIDYVTYHPMFNCLVIGLLGILVVILQFSLLAIIKRELPKLGSQVSNIESNFAHAINQQLTSWVNSTNNAINDTEASINSNLFGWVDTGTTSINNTLTQFQKSMNTALNETFQGTPLYDAVSSVVQCVIGGKISEAIEGLTWVHNEAHVTLPRISPSLVLGPTNNTIVGNQTLTRIQGSSLFPIDHVVFLDSGISDVSQSIDTVVNALIGTYTKSLMVELYVSISLIAIWLSFAIIALLYCYVKAVKSESHPSHDMSESVKGESNIPPLPAANPCPGYFENVIEEGWRYNWFHPPSFLAGNLYKNSPLASPASTTVPRPPPLPTPVAFMETRPLSVRLKHSSMVRYSTKADSDYLKD